MDLLNSLNWVDLIIVSIFARAIYVGTKRGFIVEIFKLIGVFFGLLITLHFFGSLASFLEKSIQLPKGASHFVAYLALGGITILVFKFARDTFMTLFRIEAHSVFDHWGGLVLSFLRALLLCSLLMVFLRVLDIGYFSRNTEKSFLGSRLVTVAPRVYEGTFFGFISKFFPAEELNKEAFPFKKSSEEKEKQKEKP
ncbi:MAG: CvpA family protein [Candidatus Omnitrophota bacterium]